MTVKESFNVVGLSTTFGNPLWKGTSIAEPAVSSSHLTRRWRKWDSNLGSRPAILPVFEFRMVLIRSRAEQGGSPGSAARSQRLAQTR